MAGSGVANAGMEMDVDDAEAAPITLEGIYKTSNAQENDGVTPGTQETINKTSTRDNTDTSTETKFDDEDKDDPFFSDLCITDRNTIKESGVIPAAPYSHRAPNPPAVILRMPRPHEPKFEQVSVKPEWADVVTNTELSKDDIRIILGDEPLVSARSDADQWAYEHRRTAQPILDFLWLGPSTMAMARNKEWLQKNDITMLMAARDARMAKARMMAVDRVAEDLGIEAKYFDVEGLQELIRVFPKAIDAINVHMLNMHKSATPRRGRVLVFCETGNDRSAAIVTAYIMAMLGQNLWDSAQFITMRRFCVTLDDDTKQILTTFSEMTEAQRMVNKVKHLAINHNQRTEPSDPSPDTDRDMAASIPPGPVGSSWQHTPPDHTQPLNPSRKRSFEATLDDCSDKDMAAASDGKYSTDDQRFENRDPFVPFKMVDDI